MFTDEQVILDLSDEVQVLLDQQGVDLYQVLQQEMPSIRLSRQSDPDAPLGSRDIVTVLSVTTGLIGTLTPIILRILSMITPPNRSETWIVEEIETQHADGSKTIHRKRVLASSEQRPSEQRPAHPKAADPLPSTDSSETK